MAGLFAAKITHGIWWVEFYDADLTILCGAPADSVKHLMRQGYIMPREIDGIRTESGPNAILLSDLPVQNGNFCNLAEFPVLQMLYRQGMALPGHPNNTGIKPLLIGHEDQVNAQMNYIYRGNYGLISEEEIIATGISPEVARDMMRIKLHFAFGSIKPTEDFLDTCVVDKDPVEIRNGVYVKRLRLNVYEFSYNGETIEIDLNLKEGENVPPPFPLGFHTIERDYFSVVHSGNGDGWDINRPAMSSILIYQGRIFLIDAGPNIEAGLKSLGIGVNEIEGVFHTHAHDDHLAGITSIIRTGRKLDYYATPLVRASVFKKLSALMSRDESDFENFFNVRDLTFDEWNPIGGLSVKPIYSPHPVETSIMEFRALGPDGYRTYAHLADITSFDVLEGMVTENDSAPGISREHCEKIKKQYLNKVCVKKIDAGGGMIHGEPEDFANDPSGKIILSHRAAPFSEHEKEIGSGAPFGTAERLIESHQDFSRRNAFHYLRGYFPESDPEEIRGLLNNRTLNFNPEANVLEKGDSPSSVYLLISGTVESFNAEDDFKAQITAGALIGETSCLTDRPSFRTYRTSSFVTVLQISSVQYKEFVRINDLQSTLSEARGRKSVLGKCSLFREFISPVVFSALARNARLVIVKAGTDVPLTDEDHIYVVAKGRLNRMLEGEIYETLELGDFYGEEASFIQVPTSFHMHAEEDVEVYAISVEGLKDIPVVRWKIIETHERRRR
ncbi:MAG: cyclic nucleotide-binding domain-containing protein [Rhodospirillales bacterium]|jgi:hemerythrin|nr:cyclic nucleotide-binding domain-containing protein [Rhodospirillales bacterium]MBT4041344.1 cyclic nucleotide-binding domain-containing protein [Rhodospirillales bacterium]MBT4626268.1 cyclic nucleotide-binding domain-containing protein [Rhodospirillales bacterium]MBT5353064.1 cyclic nucleotide-binding domain-containing protein [Rhodospirillales bacterium]MBT5520542.1 cyclic nucleotide-binding domain-containing protein [Rhodospirillales bacterium]